MESKGNNSLLKDDSLGSSYPSRQARLQEDTYFRLLKILNDNPKINQRELSKQLGLSLGGVNYCLKALIDKGYVKAQNFNRSKSKLGYIYLLTPKGVREKAVLTYRFLQRKIQEYSDLKTEIESLERDLGNLGVESKDLVKAQGKKVG
jgi:EPS-associated MarR family transcriptional regulator